MQRHSVPRIDPRYVDAIVLEARRQRSAYICGLIAAGFRALGDRLRPAGSARTASRCRGEPRIA